jgi:hypothetical protein
MWAVFNKRQGNSVKDGRIRRETGRRKKKKEKEIKKSEGKEESLRGWTKP